LASEEKTKGQTTKVKFDKTNKWSTKSESAKGSLTVPQVTESAPSSQKEERAVLYGGNFLEGKTTNVELDAIFQRFLPSGRTLECATLPTLTEDIVKCIRKRLLQRRRVFFPLFARHHWIAGILRVNARGKEILELHDSAPSPIVGKDVRKKLRILWPQLKVYSVAGPRQRPGSDDCGLFMAAFFFGDYLRVGIVSPDTIGARLRQLLHQTKSCQMNRRTFLPLMEGALLHKDAPQLDGGGNKRERGPEHNQVRTHGHFSAKRKLDEEFPLPPQDNVTTTRNATATQSRLDQGPPIGESTITAEHTQSVEEQRIHEALHVDPDDETNTHHSGHGHILAASALANVADGGSRPLNRQNIGMWVYRRNKARKPYPGDVQSALEIFGFHVSPLGEARGNTNGKPLFLVATTGQLPKTFSGCAFKLGAFPVDMVVRKRSFSSWRLTSSHNEASIGVYLPHGSLVSRSEPAPTLAEQSRMKQTGTQREVPTPPLTVSSPLVANTPTDMVSTSGPAPTSTSTPPPSPPARRQRREVTVRDEYERMLAAVPEQRLNGQGGLGWGQVHCPRSWHIYSHKSPHISEIAWKGITPAMRNYHRRCLQKLKAMPHNVLQMNVASAVLETVRREASAKGWNPATTLKEYSSMAGALRDLPLYTTEKHGILLTEFPEWKAAQTTVKRMEREVDKEEPHPIRLEQYQAALRELRTRRPTAALFLALMWSLAARAGDVHGLRPKDVKLQTTLAADGTVPLTVTQKFGKGTKFRGTYYPASSLPLEEATELRRVIALRHPTHRLFPDADELRTLIRTALKRQNRQAALPSVRRGAIQHLALVHQQDDQTIMRLTGHQRVSTLHRYIGHGHQATQEDAAAQEGAMLVHHPRRTS